MKTEWINTDDFYHAVQAYLRRTGQSVEAATFLPADAIIRDSGFFSRAT